MMALLLLWLVCLNVADTLLTLVGINEGLIREANPLMRWLLDHGDWYFILGKMGMILLGCWFLYRNRDQYLARIGTFGVCCFYCGVLLCHMGTIKYIWDNL